MQRPGWKQSLHSLEPPGAGNSSQGNPAPGVFSAWRASEVPGYRDIPCPGNAVRSLPGADPAMPSSCPSARAALRSLLPPAATPWSTFRIYP